MAIVPLRLPRDRGALSAHFDALGPDDLRLRFCQTMKPEAVAAYLDSLSATHAVLFGIFNRDLELVAVGQFANAADGLEVGLSVLSRYRRRGLASALLGRAANYARTHAIDALVMHCLAENVPMLALARQFGMSIETSGTEADGRMRLRAGTAVDLWTEAVYDLEGLLDLTTKRRQIALRTSRPPT